MSEIQGASLQVHVTSQGEITKARHKLVAAMNRTAGDRVTEEDVRKQVLEHVKPFADHASKEIIRKRLKLNQDQLQVPVYYPAQTINHYEQTSLLSPRQFLDDPIHHINTKEYREFCHSFFRSAFASIKYSLDDLTPFRIRSIYRIVREIARIKNLCAPDEPINSALCIKSDGTDNYMQPTTGWDTEHYCSYGHRMEKFLTEVHFMPEDCLVWYPNPEVQQRKTKPICIDAGLPLCPPPVPLKNLGVTDTGGPTVLDGYIPEEDVALMLFIEQIRMVIDQIGVSNGTPNDPESGFLGLQGVLDPLIIRMAWPTRTELFAFEYILITETLDYLVKNSIKKTREMLYQCYGFNEIEIDGTLKIARQMARKITEQDQDEDRALSLLRLEEYADRTRESLDLKAEMNARKQMAMVTGLTRAEANDTMKEFMDVVSKVSARAARKATEMVLEHTEKPAKTEITSNSAE